MKIRNVLLFASLGTLLVFALATAIVPSYLDATTNTVIEHNTYKITSAAKKLHQTLIIGDLHADSLIWDRDLLERHDRGHLDIPRMREGNVALQMFTSFTKIPAGINYNKNASDARDRVTPLLILQGWPIDTWTSLTARAVYLAKKLESMADRAPEQFQLVRNHNELKRLLNRRADGEKVVGGIIGTEGSHALDGKLENIDILYDVGYRMMSLQHFFDNELGGSLHGESGAGLTTFGRLALQKMISKNIMIDLSHSSVKVVEDVLALSQIPLLVSHTGLYGHCPKRRNISDDLMVKIASRGGLIGIGFWEEAICDPSPASIVAAIRYGIDLLGVDHIALGSDFDGATATTFDVSELVILTEEMLKADFSESEIRQVMGENMMRYLSDNLPAE